MDDSIIPCKKMQCSVQERSHRCGNVGIEAVKEWDECLHTPGKVIKRQGVVLTASYGRWLLVFAASET